MSGGPGAGNPGRLVLGRIGGVREPLVLDATLELIWRREEADPSGPLRAALEWRRILELPEAGHSDRLVQEAR